MTTKKLVTPQEMAKILGVKTSWVYLKAEQGLIPKIKVGHYLRFDPDKVIASFPETKPKKKRKK